jgi:4-carboxymuconolactone decarboxylase
MSKAPPPPLREKLRAIVPKLIRYSNEILYGQVWERPGLSKRDRSLITVACLFGMSRPDFVKVHMERALENGVTTDELSELITHLAFYAGWPAAMSAAQTAQSIIEAKDVNK